MKRSACFLILFLVTLPVQGKMPTLEDEQYKTACGPIACVLALQTLGIETSLDEMAERCDWEQDEFLPLENLQKALHSYRGIGVPIAMSEGTENLRSYSYCLSENRKCCRITDVFHPILRLPCQRKSCVSLPYRYSM